MMGVAEVMVLEYNGRKKSGSSHRLLIRNLYEKPKKEKEAEQKDLFDDEDPMDLTDEDMDESLEFDEEVI